jgi:hypothetical protein
MRTLAIMTGSEQYTRTTPRGQYFWRRWSRGCRGVNCARWKISTNRYKPVLKRKVFPRQIRRTLHPLDMTA